MARSTTRKQRQTIPLEQKYTRRQFNVEFPNDEACFRHIAESRFPCGRTICVPCGKERKHHRVSGRKALACDVCGRHIYPMAGTIFEKSTTGLRLWFEAIYLMGSTRCGISAKQLQRETGVTYKTAWRMFRQIRSLLSEEPKLADSSTEMDETHFGGERHGQGISRRLTAIRKHSSAPPSATETSWLATHGTAAGLRFSAWQRSASCRKALCLPTNSPATTA